MHAEPRTRDPRTLLSVLWIFLLMNILFRDIHQFLAPGYLDQITAGVVFGQEITDALLLFGGFAVEVMILMVLMPHVLPRRVIRVVNSAAVVFTTGLVLYTPPTDPDDVFFWVVVLATLLVIAWIGWRRFAGPADQSHQPFSSHT